MTRAAVQAALLPSPIGRTSWARRALDAVLMLFLLSCVFDPADLLLGLKVWLFLLAWGLTMVRAATTRTMLSAPYGLLAYTVLFIAVPLLSIIRYAMADGSMEFEGLNLLKGYMLVPLALMLVLNRIDLLPRLAMVLSTLAVTILGTYVALQLMPELYAALYVFGAQTGIVLVDTREYGEDVSLLQVYFVTSPMLAISIAWYAQRAQNATSWVARRAASVMVVLHAVAMIVAGTRNNILVAITLPLALWFLHARHKTFVTAAAAGVAASLALVFADELRAFFDPNEVSNSIKLALLADYGRILSDPWTLMFGRGLGAYDLWHSKSMYYYISELTYLEMVRNFGLPGALLMLGLLLLPIRMAVSTRGSSAERALAVGYAFYLAMCISNPNLFSSMGILILCVLLARLYSMASRATTSGVAQ